MPKVEKVCYELKKYDKVLQKVEIVGSELKSMGVFVEVSLRTESWCQKVTYLFAAFYFKHNTLKSFHF